MTTTRIGVWAFWALTLALCLGFGGHAAYQVATGFQFEVQMQLNRFPSPVPLGIHIALAGLAILLGPWQFLRAIRVGHPTIHRWTGRTYVLCCVLGGITGGTISLFTFAGPFAGWGFLSLAICWEIATITGWRLAVQRNFDAHQRWMIRSFALTLAAVTFRTYLQIATPFFPEQNDFNLFYGINTWMCWIPNLIVAEIIIATMLKPKRPRPQAVATQA